MKKFFSRLITAISVLIIFAFVIYTAAWFYMAHLMDRQFATFFARNDLTISGTEPRITGFPAPPKFEFSGRITDRNGYVFDLPKLEYQGFPLPTQSISIRAPQGLEIHAFQIESPLQIDNFRLDFIIPRHLPRNSSHASLLAWRDAGNKIEITNLFIKRQNLVVDGAGYLTLDQNLQPEGQLNTKLSGLDDLLLELVEDRKIDKQKALLAQSFLNLLSQKNIETGDTFVPVPIRIQDSFMYLGPIKALPLPLLNLAGDQPTMPAPHQ